MVGRYLLRCRSVLEWPGSLGPEASKPSPTPLRPVATVFIALRGVSILF